MLLQVMDKLWNRYQFRSWGKASSGLKEEEQARLKIKNGIPGKGGTAYAKA